MQELNINSYVKVKLTEDGQQAVVSFNKDIDESSDEKQTMTRANNVDEDGYIKLQLWELMRVFGKHCSVDANNLFEDNNLYIYDKSLSQIDL